MVAALTRDLAAADARRRRAAGEARPGRRDGPYPRTPPAVAAADATGDFLSALGHDRLLVLNARGGDKYRPLWLTQGLLD